MSIWWQHAAVGTVCCILYTAWNAITARMGACKCHLLPLNSTTLFSTEITRNATRLHSSRRSFGVLFLDQSNLDDLKSELPHYLPTAEDTSQAYDPMEFWKPQELSLCSLAKAARKVLFVQPSSAASERVFSLRNKYFQQNSALQNNRLTGIVL